jgi:transposase
MIIIILRISNAVTKRAAKIRKEPAMNNNIIIGMDLGDKFHLAVVFDGEGNELSSSKIINTKKAIAKFFESYKGAKIAIEAGTHSAWISRMLTEMGLTVYVGNPRKLRLIWDSNDKSDIRDARILGRVCRIDPELLHLLRHRGSQAQVDLTLIKSRNALIKNRTQLINHIRGLVKANGERLPVCSSESFAKRCEELVPDELRPALESVFKILFELNQQIKELENKIECLSIEQYPETQNLRQVPGVGPITALAFVLTLEDPLLFAKSRQVGPFLGLTPRRDQSGETDKQLSITKAGNPYLRQLLVGCAHYIMGPFGPDSHLRQTGLAIAARGGKNAKKRAVVAVARKLSILLHRLWVTKEAYDPFYGMKKKQAA